MEKRMVWVKPLVWISCTLILAVGIILAAHIASKTLADRPLSGSFSGSLSSGSYPDQEIMGIDALRMYLGIYPEAVDYEQYYEQIDSQSQEMPVPVQEAQYHDPYLAAEQKLSEELKAAILGGTWPGFPYVQLGDRLYFSKQAVDDWFMEQGKLQLKVP